MSGFGDAPSAEWATKIEDIIAGFIMDLASRADNPIGTNGAKQVLDELWEARGERFDGRGPTRPFGSTDA